MTSTNIFHPKNSCFCQRKKILRNNLDRISRKLLSIDFIWSILLKYECFRRDSMIKLNQK